jgi:hypothetical protein
MPSTTAVSDQQAPFANRNGLVAAPNVDLSQEMVGPDDRKLQFFCQCDGDDGGRPHDQDAARYVYV